MSYKRSSKTVVCKKEENLVRKTKRLVNYKLKENNCLLKNLKKKRTLMLFSRILKMRIIKHPYLY